MIVMGLRNNNVAISAVSSLFSPQSLCHCLPKLIRPSCYVEELMTIKMIIVCIVCVVYVYTYVCVCMYYIIYLVKLKVYMFSNCDSSPYSK